VRGYQPLPRGAVEAEQAGHRAVGNLRGRKHSIYEGGFRVPSCALVGKVPKATVSSEVISLADLLATFADIFGDKLRLARPRTVTASSRLAGDQLARPIREAIVLHNAEGFSPSDRALEVDRSTQPAGQQNNAWRAEGFNQLYNLDDDPSEKSNIWEKHPEWSPD